MSESFIQVPPNSTGEKTNTSTHNNVNGDLVHTPGVSLVDRLNPTNRQAVDNQGQAFVRFAEGSPAFDVFGRTIGTESDLVNIFKFYTGDHINDFEKKVVGTADAVFDPLFAGLKLTTGTANGDSVKYTSHRYHHCRPGNGMPALFAARSADAGKVGLTRRMGLFDDDDGVFFEIVDTDINVVVRSSLTGLEDRIPRASWNGDRLDGSLGDNNLSGQTLDPTKNNVWWIDYQPGAGAIRFGTYINGDKTVCHIIGHYNELDRQWMGASSLPYRIEQTNTSVTGSSSEMWLFCVVIQNEGYPDVFRSNYGISNSLTLTSETFVPLISFKPTELTALGKANRARIIPRMVSILADSIATEFIITIGSPLTGATFSNSVENCEYDTTATAMTVGKVLGALMCAGGHSDPIDLTKLFDIARDGIWRQADITQSLYLTVGVRLMAPGTSIVGATLNVLEIE